MSMSMPARRRIGWVAAAALALALADRFFGPGLPDEAVVAPVVKDRPAASGRDGRAPSTSPETAARAAIDADLARLGRQPRRLAGASFEHDDKAVASDPFAPVVWAAPAASSARMAQAAAPPAPPPVAPPFPYAYVGGLVEDGIRTLFFAKGERVLAVKAGDLVDAAFRIEEIDEKQMKLTYLPMNQSAVVALKSP